MIPLDACVLFVDLFSRLVAIAFYKSDSYFSRTKNGFFGWSNFLVLSLSLKNDIKILSVSKCGSL